VAKHERRVAGFDDKILAAALRPIDTAPSADAVGAALDTFERSPWAPASRRSSRRGDEPGRTSFHFSRFHRRSDA
jgi:hypothetical protein